MKKILPFVFVCWLISGFSQNTIPNAGFENWSDENNATDWYGLSIDLIVYQLYTFSQSPDAHVGSYAAKVETIDATLVNLPGIACLSPISFDLMAGGIVFGSAGTPINVRPTSITGNLKYNQMGSDTAAIIVVLTKWNTGTSQRDTVGYFGTLINSPSASYVPFNISINVSQTPDSMNIMLVSSGGYEPQVGSQLFVDNLDMTFLPNTGIETPSLFSLEFYPNPATDEVLFSLPESGNSVIAIYDSTGKLIRTERQFDQVFYIDVRNLQQGIYQIVLMQNNNTYTHKILVLR